MISYFISAGSTSPHRASAARSAAFHFLVAFWGFRGARVWVHIWCVNCFTSLLHFLINHESFTQPPAAARVLQCPAITITPAAAAPTFYSITGVPASEGGTFLFIIIYLHANRLQPRRFMSHHRRRASIAPRHQRIVSRRLLKFRLKFWRSCERDSEAMVRSLSSPMLLVANLTSRRYKAHAPPPPMSSHQRPRHRRRRHSDIFNRPCVPTASTALHHPAINAPPSRPQRRRRPAHFIRSRAISASIPPGVQFDAPSQEFGGSGERGTRILGEFFALNFRSYAHYDVRTFKLSSAVCTYNPNSTLVVQFLCISVLTLDFRDFRQINGHFNHISGEGLS